MLLSVFMLFFSASDCGLSRLAELIETILTVVSPPVNALANAL
jgi:hypothetical protein